MNREKQRIFENLDRAIIKVRGIYSEWANKWGISYHEMLVLYSIRETGFCTQKQICGNYLLPKQTVHHVITILREEGILEYDEVHSRGREKAFALSEKGRQYAAPFLQSLNDVEERALELLGAENLEMITELLLKYDRALNQAVEESTSKRGASEGKKKIR